MNKEIMILVVLLFQPLIGFGRNAEKKECKSQICTTVDKSIKRTLSVAKTGIVLYFFRDIAIEIVRQLPEIINTVRADHTQITIGSDDQF